MSRALSGTCAAILGASSIIFSPLAATGEPMHGIAMYGNPVLPDGFEALAYANPDAPKGGRIAYGVGGTFDSLNPYILKGRSPAAIRTHVYETLMGRNWDEPFSLYGLLAETIETDEGRNWVEFTLREEARFSDGSPVTVDDVMWSFETLGTEGNPRYWTAWKKIDSMEQTGPRSLKFTFNTVDRELPLILGLRPILQKAQWDGRDFAESSLDIPIGSGPYVLDSFETGRSVTFKRNPEYWGRNLGFNKGRNNFDEISYEYFGDSVAVFEAFKAGEFDTYTEWDALKWTTNYDFPAVRNGEIVKSEVPHRRPSGIGGFVFNTRKRVFNDWRVRDALIHAFNFEFINNTLNGGTEARITSYFSNSVLGMDHAPAAGKVRSLLVQFQDHLIPGALEGYSLPESDGTERNRANIRKAIAILEEAGWTADSEGVLRNEAGESFEFEILLVQGSDIIRSVANIFTESLKRLGIETRVTSIDSAQYRERVISYDYDMIWYRWGLSLSPGNEQKLYWGSDGVTAEGTRNYMGVNSPAVDGLIVAILEGRTQDDFRSAVKALDRALTSGRYVIPVWYSDYARIAHKKELKFPEYLPIYGHWIGWQPDVWWHEE